MNELTTLDTVSRNYDDNGNYTAASSTYKYDFRNQLAGMNASGGKTYEWHFDAFGRCVERERTDATATGPRSYYDGKHMVERVRYNSGVPIELEHKQYVFGNEIDEVIALQYSPIGDADEMRFFHTDHLFSTQVIADDTGAVEESYRYEEFGQSSVLDDSFVVLAAWAASPLGNIFRYTGRPFASTASPSGNDQWVDLRSRHYAAQFGMFNQRDSARFVDGSSLYACAKVRPTMFRDPLGRAAGPVSGNCQPNCNPPKEPEPPLRQGTGPHGIYPGGGSSVGPGARGGTIGTGGTGGGPGGVPGTVGGKGVPLPLVYCVGTCDGTPICLMFKEFVKKQFEKEKVFLWIIENNGMDEVPCFQIHCVGGNNYCTKDLAYKNTSAGNCLTVDIHPEKYDTGSSAECQEGGDEGGDCPKLGNELQSSLINNLMFHLNKPSGAFEWYDAKATKPCQ